MCASRDSSASRCSSATCARAIVDHFGDGGRFGVEIDYSHLPAERPHRPAHPARPPTCSTTSSCSCTATTTGRCASTTLWRALPRGAAARSRSPSTRTGTATPATTSCVDATASSRSSTARRTAPGSTASRSATRSCSATPCSTLLPQEQDDCSSRRVYPQLVARGQLGAYVTRAPLLQRRLARAAAADGGVPRPRARRDPATGTGRSTGGRRAPSTCARPDELGGCPERSKRFACWRDAGYTRDRRLEPGRHRRGALTPEAELDAIHAAAARGRRARPAGGSTRSTTARTTGTRAASAASPRPGMLFQAQREFHLDLDAHVLPRRRRARRPGRGRGRAARSRSSRTRAPLLDLVRDLIAGRLKKELAHDHA